MKKYLSILLAVLMVVGLTACKNKTTTPSTPGVSVNMPSIEDSKNNEDVVAIRTPATDTEQAWFNQALREYIETGLNTDNYYMSTNVYDTKSDINASNALNRASAIVILCVDSNTINADKASSFSDGLAKKVALDKAAGEINFTIYRIPHDIYIQITDANYNTAIKESTGTEGFSKFSFSYAGTGDAILDSPSVTPSTQPSTEVPKTPSEDLPSNNQTPEEETNSTEPEQVETESVEDGRIDEQTNETTDIANT